MKTAPLKIPFMRRSAAIACAAISFLTCQWHLSAADKIWNGGGDQTSWSDPLNWGGAGGAAGNDRLFFGGATGLTPNNNTTLNTIYSNITFNADAGAFTLSGNTIKLSAGSTAVGGVTNLSANPQTISFTIDNNGGGRVYSALSNDIVITANINNNTLIKEGPFTLTLANTINDSSLAATVNNGTLVLAGTVSSAIGSTLQINTNGAVIVSGSADEINANVRVNVEQGGTLDIRHLEEIGMLASTGAVSGVILNNSNAVATFQCGGFSNHKGIFNGSIQDGTAPLNYELHRDGHIQVFNGVSSYSGTTTVDNNQSATPSRLIVNGVHTNGGAYAINSNKGTLAAPAAYLCGTGLISAAFITIGTGATGVGGAISPGGALSTNSDSGTFSDTTGILTISNNLVKMNTNATLTVQLNGTTVGSGYDQLVIAGNAVFTNAGANLNLALGYAPSPGDTFTIVLVHGTDATNDVSVFTSLNGIVTDLSQGATFVEPNSGKTFKISYRAEGATFDMGAGNGNDIMLQVVAAAGGQNLSWRGDGVNNVWDVATTADWWNGTSLTTTTNGDFVTFDDTGSNNLPVNLTTAVSPATVLVNATKNYEFGGGGPGGPGFFTNTVILTKTNSGTLTITTDNQNLGSTIVQAGTLRVGTNGTSGTLSGSLSIQSNGVVVFNRADDVTITLPISGGGGFVHAGSGALILTTPLTFSGNTTNSGGTLQIGDGTAANDIAGIGGNIYVGSSNNVLYNYSGNGNVTIGNSLSGSGTVTYQVATSARTFTFGAVTNTAFTGTNVVTSFSRLEIATAAAEPSGPIVVQDKGAFYTHAGSTFTNAQPITIIGQGPGSPVDTPFGKGALRLGNAWAGPVILSGDTTIGASAGSGALLGNISDGGNNFTVTYFGGTISVGPTTGVNTYGVTLIAEDQLGAASTSANTTIVALNSNVFGQGVLEMKGQTTLQLNGNNISIPNLIDQSTLGVSNFPPVIRNGSSTAAAVLTLGADNNGSTFSGIFGNGGSQPFGLNKIGTGILTITGDNTNTGTVKVSAGTLALTPASGFYVTGDPVIGSGSFSNAQFAVSAGAVLDVTGRSDGTLTLNNSQTLSGSGTVNGNVKSLADSTINPGDAIGTLNISGSLTLGGTLLMELNRTNTPANSDRLNVSGGTTYGGTLVVTNIGPALQANDTFQLFGSGVSGFSGVNIATSDANGNAYTWENDIGTLGSIKVLTVSSLVNAAPTNIVVSVTNGTLTLSWPQDHTGWRLQSNSVSLTDTNSWFDYVGSTQTNQVGIAIDPSKPNVFYRMVYP